ncbi:MAG: hypothetical protein WBE56_03720 [Terracidiphilus sp.]
MTSTGFSLVKWYPDCVTDTGEVAILYSARVKWRGMSLAYSNFIGISGESRTERSSMRSAKIEPTADTITVAAFQRDLCGLWTAKAAPFERTVFKNEQGSVVWNCLQPSAAVRVTTEGREWTGLGYAECLTLTLPPWKLPMRHLRWGRFVSAQDALAWIDWQGPYSLNLAVHNGVQAGNATVSDSEISCDRATLRMAESASIRSGRLASTILPGAPALARMFPSSIFSIEEKKWRSRGVLETADHQALGWVIHEAVEWKV